MGTRSDGGGFWWDQSAIKFMLPQVMKQVTYNLLQVGTYSGTCTIFVNEFLTTTLYVVVNNVEKVHVCMYVEKVHMYTYMNVCVQCVTQHGTCVQSKGIKGNKCDF